MPDDGLRFEVDEKKFIKMTQNEKLLTLFRIMIYQNNHGCRWARHRWRRIMIGGFSLGGISGAIVNIPGVGKYIAKFFGIN